MYDSGTPWIVTHGILPGLVCYFLLKTRHWDHFHEELLIFWEIPAETGLVCVPHRQLHLKHGIEERALTEQLVASHPFCIKNIQGQQRSVREKLLYIQDKQLQGRKKEREWEYYLMLIEFDFFQPLVVWKEHQKSGTSFCSCFPAPHRYKLFHLKGTISL